MDRFFHRRLCRLIPSLVLMFACSGCALYTRVAVDLGSPVVDSMRDSFNDNCDLAIVKESLPFTLAGITGLIDTSPKNKTFLINGSNAYFAYAFAFVEQGDVVRARGMYLKARDYGMRALFGEKYLETIDLPLEEFEDEVKKIRKKQVPALFWATLSWLNYIRLNLGDLGTYVEVPRAELMAKRLLELDETYYFGTPHAVMACYYAAQPEMSGGDPEKAKAHFEKAIAISEKKFLVHYLLYAQFYAVRQQDKELYVKLLTHIREAPENILPGHCAATNMCKMRAWRYLKDVDSQF